jgi:hypothetical protein
VAKVTFSHKFSLSGRNFTGASMSKRILVIAGVGAAISGYYIFFEERDDLIYLFSLSVLAAVIAYVFQYQIDNLATRGVAQKLDGAMRSMLLHTTPHFALLKDEVQHMAEDRMKRWVMKKEFISKHDQAAPEDVKFIMAYYAILLTLHQEDYLYDDIDRIIFYHHPFLTPAYPDDVHISELEVEDGTIVISFMHVLKGHFEKGYYNIALHVMAEAYKHKYIKEPISWHPDIWDHLETISSISRDKIEDYIGLPVNDPWPVAVHHQLMYRDAEIAEVFQVLPQFIKRTA